MSSSRDRISLPSTISDAAIARLPPLETNVDLEWRATPPSTSRPYSKKSTRAVQQHFSGKAPESDAIPAEVYKQGCLQVMDHLTDLSQEMWRQGEVPKFVNSKIVHPYNRPCILCRRLRPQHYFGRGQVKEQGSLRRRLSEFRSDH
nr:unnamed protein product [Spirometra erinaceieuropaei]